MAHTWRQAMPAAIAFAALLPTSAGAASQGSLGASSRGSITISASVAAPARISGLSDFALDGAGATAAHSAAQDVCLKGASHTYTIAASGSGPGGTLSLSNGDESMAYRIEWRSRAPVEVADELSAEAPLVLEAVADPAECERAPGSGQIRIALEPADSAKLLGTAPYSGTLMLTLAPD